MKIIISGSMFFYDQFIQTKKVLENRGHQVITPRKDPLPEPIPKEMKYQSILEFNKNLKKSDALLVMNYTKNEKSNYIGPNTLMEIGMALILNKKIFLLNPPPENCRHELEAINCQILNGNLDLI